MIADYTSSDLGPYREAFVLTAAMHGGALVWFCPLIFVTSDAALAAGREIWGFPKKLAQIAFDVDGESVSACIERNGASVFVAGSLPAERLAERERLEAEPTWARCLRERNDMEVEDVER